MSTPRTQRIVDDLLRQTNLNRSHPFASIVWNAPEYAIDPVDPIWLSCIEGPIAPQGWFQQLGADDQARFAMERICAFFLAGVEFETGLSAGLLQYAQRPEIDHQEFSYIYEEIIEEAQHSLMFRTFVQRCSPELIDLAQQATGIAKIGQKVAQYALESPLLFLCGVLCGEEPIDYVQRSYLRLPEERQHPLVSTVCALHVAEEARHLRFARTQMRELLENSSPRDVARVKRFMPFLSQQMAEYMLDIPQWFATRWSIPEEELSSHDWRTAQRAYQREASSKLMAFGRSCELVSVAA
jgi:hypothetical protein